MTDRDLDRIANDLEFIRTIGNLAPSRKDSLRLAAGLVRSIVDGRLAAALDVALVRKAADHNRARAESGR